METDISGPALFVQTLASSEGYSYGIPAILLIFFLLLSGFLSFSEKTLFSLIPYTLEKPWETGPKTDIRLIRLLNRLDYLKATFFILQTLLRTAIAVLIWIMVSDVLLVQIHEIWAVMLVILAASVVIGFFCEWLPATITPKRPEILAQYIASPLRGMQLLFLPFVSILSGAFRAQDPRSRSSEETLHSDDIGQALDLNSEEEIRTEEILMYKGIRRFGNTTVREIMVSRIDMVSVSESRPYDELLNVITSSGYSRIPVYRGTPDTMIGVLYIKDLLNHIQQGSDYQWQKHIRQPYLVPENKKIDSLLKEFQENKIHMAIVVDEYGGTSGLVTLEDVVEEIVGEIDDELDTENESSNYTRVDDSTFVFDGKTLLNDFSKTFSLPDDYFIEPEGEFETLAGLILEIEGRLPEKHEVIFFRDFEFRIDAVDSRRIKKIRVIRRTAEEDI